MKKMNKKGFTIVELVIVIAVIAILSAVLIPTFSGVVTDANKTAVAADAKAKYQEYMAANITNYEADAVYGDKGYYVAIVDSQVYAEDGKTVFFDSLAKALEKVELTEDKTEVAKAGDKELTGLLIAKKAAE